RGREDRRVERDIERHSGSHTASGRGSGKRAALRPGAQRKGAGREPRRLAHAAGEQAMTSVKLPIVALALSAPIGFVLVAGQQAPPSVYTAAQAGSGRAVYQASCASCHLPDLAGRNEAPQLAGNNFMNTWRSRTTRDLFEFIQSTMPPTGETLSAEQYLAVTAFILQANGAQTGPQPLTANIAAP